MAKLKGIDVSAWNGSINWEKAKKEIDFAIIRVGYGSNLARQDDTAFKRNADACTRLGIPFGVYIYSYADNTAKAKSEAEHVIRLVKGYNLEYPVYYDLEDEGTTGKCSNGAILNMAKIFAATIEKAGYKVGFYANKHWWTTRLVSSYYNGYSRWVAQYNTKCTYTGEYDIWQYSSKGAVDGIRGNVDMNYGYKDLAQSNLAIGDKVRITGSYAASAYDKRANHKKAKGDTAYIVNVYKGTTFPYQLGAKKGDTASENTIGFAKKTAIKKL